MKIRRFDMWCIGVAASLSLFLVVACLPAKHCRTHGNLLHRTIIGPGYKQVTGHAGMYRYAICKDENPKSLGHFDIVYSCPACQEQYEGYVSMIPLQN